MKILIDGKIKEQKKTSIDTGYFYGYGVFETIMVREGVPVLAKAHLDRLNRGLESIHINKAIERKTLDQAIAMMRLWNGALKVNVSEGHTVCTVREVNYTADQYAQGARLTLSEVKRNPTSPSVYIKSMNYMDNMLEMRKAKEKGYQDALFINPAGEVCETAVANIFFIKDQRVMTPPVKSGLLAGVVRQWLIDHLEVEEVEIQSEAIASMDGAFITNSLMGLMRVSEIDGVTFEDHPMVHDLTKKYVDGVLKSAVE